MIKSIEEVETINPFRAIASAEFLLNQAKGLMLPRVHAPPNLSKAREHIKNAMEILSNVWSKCNYANRQLY